MSNKIDGLFQFTSPHVMAHPALFEAKPFMRNGKAVGGPKFSASFVMAKDSADYKDVQAHAVRIAKATWPGVDLKDVKFPFASGDKLNEKRKAKGKKAGDWQSGKVVMAARSKYQPRLSMLANGGIAELDDETKIAANKGKFYFGVEALAQFNFVATEVDDKKSVSAYLNMVLTTNKGTKIAGGAAAAEVFKGYAGKASDVDPTGDESLDDELGIF